MRSKQEVEERIQVYESYLGIMPKDAFNYNTARSAIQEQIKLCHWFLEEQT